MDNLILLMVVVGFLLLVPTYISLGKELMKCSDYKKEWMGITGGLLCIIAVALAWGTGA